jgi:hypothetical protein
MSAKDAVHDAVRHALEKDGWLITHDPYYMKVGGVEMYIDLGSEAVLAAERNGEKIAVEIKSFLGTSTISEFHTALGQFINYQLALEEKNPTERYIWRLLLMFMRNSSYCHLSKELFSVYRLSCLFTMICKR